MATQRGRSGGAVVALLLLLGLAVGITAAGAQVPGRLIQLAGTDACVSETGSGGACADGVALDVRRHVSVKMPGKQTGTDGQSRTRRYS